jgi:hypothetical protein
MTSEHERRRDPTTRSAQRSQPPRHAQRSQPPRHACVSVRLGGSTVRRRRPSRGRGGLASPPRMRKALLTRSSARSGRSIRTAPGTWPAAWSPSLSRLMQLHGHAGQTHPGECPRDFTKWGGHGSRRAVADRRASSPRPRRCPSCTRCATDSASDRSRATGTHRWRRSSYVPRIHRS